MGAHRTMYGVNPRLIPKKSPLERIKTLRNINFYLGGALVYEVALERRWQEDSR